jgi:hypothetical protein
MLCNPKGRKLYDISRAGEEFMNSNGSERSYYDSEESIEKYSVKNSTAT